MSARASVELVVFLALLASSASLIFYACGATGCTPPPPVVPAVENAAAIAQYDQALVACKAVARDAGSFSTFEACEERVSRSLCVASIGLRQEWPRCAELGVLP